MKSDSDSRFDVASHGSLPRVAIIGAGISGLICGRTLADHDFDITVFEKSRGVGGRMSTRRTKEGLRFDHGAQYFTVHDSGFERHVNSWVRDGVVALWQGRIGTLSDGRVELHTRTTPRFVGIPGMNAVCRHLAADLHVEFEKVVSPPDFKASSWCLSDDRGERLGEFDVVISSAPAPQSANLLTRTPLLQQLAVTTKMNACWAVMLALEEPLELPLDGAFVHDSPLSWIARNDSKPDRAANLECWILHASSEFSNRYSDQQPQEMLPKLLEAFWHAIGSNPRKPAYATCHLWRYAIPLEPLPERCLFDPQFGIGACGDWCGGPRVEGAFHSGVAMAESVLSYVEKRG